MLPEATYHLLKNRLRKHYLDLPCVVHDDESEQDDRGEADKAFQSEGIQRFLQHKNTTVPQRAPREAAANPQCPDGRAGVASPRGGSGPGGRAGLRSSVTEESERPVAGPSTLV